jgi:cytochrome P450
VSAQDLPFVPPAPVVLEKDLPLWRFLWNLTQSTVAIWPNRAFEAPTAKNRIMGLEFLIPNDPIAVRHVLITNPTNYRCPTAVRRIARPILGTGLVLADGDDWRRQRRLLAPAFTPANINLLLPHFQAAGLHMLHSIRNESKVNLSMVFRRTAWEVVFRALFSMSEDGASERLNRLAQGYLQGPGRANLFDVFAKSENTFAFGNRSRERFRNVWFTTIEGLISEHQAQSSGTDHHLLDLLLNLKDADTGNPLSKKEIRDQCATLFVAGSETTGRLMFWAIYLITQDIEEQAKSRAEIAAFPPARVRNLNDLQHWPRLRNVLLEALRLYPPAAFIVREAIDADEVGGVRIAAKTQVWFSAWVMHRHRKFWDQPTAFIPDRFASKLAPWTQTPSYIPFGAGPRTCIGFSFALSEAQVVLAMLLERYKITLPAGKPVLPIGRTMIEPSYEPIFRLEAI